MTRKNNGKCIQCGQPLDREGIYCAACNSYNNKNSRKHVHELHEQGICSTCRKPLEAGRKTLLCGPCAAKLRLRARMVTAERREKHLCVQCGAPADGRSQCRRCLDMVIERRRKALNLELRW